MAGEMLSTDIYLYEPLQQNKFKRRIINAQTE